MNLLYLSASGGGLDTNVKVLAKAYAEEGHKVHILYLEAQEAVSRSHPNIKIHHQKLGNKHYYLYKGLKGFLGLSYALRMYENSQAFEKAFKRILATEKIDLVEIPEIYIRHKAFRGIPYFVRLHSASWTWREMLGEGRFFDRYEKWTEKRLLQKAAGISSPSKMLAEHITKVLKVERPISIIPYPVETESFAPSQKSSYPVILFAGRVEKRKGADLLLDATESLLRKHPDAQFVFAGKVCSDLESRVKILEGNSSFQFLGVLNREVLKDWYRKAWVFCAPSLWDNSPNTIYEAMSCGTPVVASRAGGISELVEDSVTGFLFPPGNLERFSEKINLLMDDQELRNKTGENARQKALRCYSEKTIAAQTKDFYKKHVGKS